MGRGQGRSCLSRVQSITATHAATRVVDVARRVACILRRKLHINRLQFAGSPRISG